MNAKELLERRMKIWTEMSTAWAAANEREGGPTAEDRAAFERANKEIQTIEDNLIIHRRHAELETAMKASLGRITQPGDVHADSGGEKRYSKAGRRLSPKEIARNSQNYRDAFTCMLQRGRTAVLSDASAAPAWNEELRSYMGSKEFRALTMDSDITGGYLVPPQEFVDELIIFVNNIVFVRQLAKVITVEGAQTLGVPSLDTDISAPTWTTEIGNFTAGLDSSMAFGKRTLTPSMLVKGCLISNELLMRAASVQELVKERLGYQFAVTMENAFMNGTGVQQPLGLFVASSQGIPTTQDTTTATTATIAYPDLVTLKYSLKEQYQRSPSLTWFMSRYITSQIMQLTDSQNRPLWQPSLQLDQPDRLLNIPIRMSEYCPSQSSLVSGTYAALLGDLRWYYICDVEGAEGLTMQRLDELYAATNQTGFIGRLRSDGMPALAEAFVRLKLK